MQIVNLVKIKSTCLHSAGFEKAPHTAKELPARQLLNLPNEKVSGSPLFKKKEAVSVKRL